MAGDGSACCAAATASAPGGAGDDGIAVAAVASAAPAPAAYPASAAPAAVSVTAPGRRRSSTSARTSAPLTGPVLPHSMTGEIGTLLYMAPEVLRGEDYGPACDCWSIGVILFVLVSGTLPFRDGMSGVAHRIKQGAWSFSDTSYAKEAFGCVSKECKHLIRGLLTLDPSSRMTLDQAVKHSWFTSVCNVSSASHGAAVAAVATAAGASGDTARCTLPPQGSPHPLHQSLPSHLRQYRASCGFRKLAVHALARTLGQADMGELRTLFRDFDTDGNGTVSMTELKRGLRRVIEDGKHDQTRLETRVRVSSTAAAAAAAAAAAGAPARTSRDEVDAAAERFLSEMDADGDGLIDYEEFLEVMLTHRRYLAEDRLRDAFAELDTQRTGWVSTESLLAVERESGMLSRALGLERCGGGGTDADGGGSGGVSMLDLEAIADVLVDEADADGNGLVDFEEFRRVLTSFEAPPAYFDDDPTPTGSPKSG